MGGLLDIDFIMFGFMRRHKKKTIYYGKVEKVLKRVGGVYVLGYWSEGENYDDDAEDYGIKKSSLAT